MKTEKEKERWCMVLRSRRTAGKETVVDEAFYENLERTIEMMVWLN
jgi:hypothetical protein